MAKTGSKEKGKKKVETLTHEKAKRLNIPTAEYQSVMRTEELSPVRVAYERRNRDLDPQLVWRGKDEQDWSDLVVPAPPLYIQEKIHPKVLIDDLERRSEANAKSSEPQIDLFANFNGLPSEAAKTEFYQHDAHWANRMILGDSLQVMASLAEREGLRGKVQCVYVDPPYGIKFNSNFQWSTTSRDVKDGNVDHITREPEQVKAFRDTWRDGIHSYLTYLRDRLTVARDLLCESGSIFVQIGEENVYRVRAVLDEVFGADNFCSTIAFRTTGAQTSGLLAQPCDFLLWYARRREALKFRQLYLPDRTGSWSESQDLWIEESTGERRRLSNEEKSRFIDLGAKVFRHRTVEPKSGGESTSFELKIEGRPYRPKEGKGWSSNATGMARLLKANRLMVLGKSVRYPIFYGDFGYSELKSLWSDTMVSGFSEPKVFVVQTATKVIQRCILMTTDTGDLVLDPTCGSGTTAYVAEQWGRRWITIDTSRVALALARARVMGARYPYYLLADSREGQLKEAEITGKAPSEMPTHLDVRQGFVYERVPNITLRSIANNAEIDVIWDEHQAKLEPLRQQLNQTLKTTWEEWEIPREADDKWPKRAYELHAEWWKERIARQKAMDASIAAKAEFEYLYDKPYEDNKKVRVAGPFTVESLSPHRVLPVGEDDELLQKSGTFSGDKDDEADFVEMILENLKTAGVQQAHKEDKITFSSITPWPGYFVCAEGKYTESNGKGRTEKRAGIFIGPEFGTVSRPDLVAAAREAGDAGFDVLITCAFNYDAHSSEFNKLGKIPVLKARMNADLHMSDELKNTGKGNLFVIFGEPDIQILKAKDGQIQVKIIGVDVFHPTTGEVRSDGAEGIACWFVDTDYNEESFFVRQAYFLGANDPYKALKTTLKAEINEEAWATLHSDTSRPFDKPKSGRIAVKVINHLGDEVMKVFKV
ncbi:MAG TPA: site-specific DNA-methyltransferase [Terriglobales bacterium]|nr:site-specific DNA-methyltransferase [Terriglobales bacterium]